MRLRRLSGVHRPGIAILAPTVKGPVAICDVGANVNCRPPHLHQYGVMASLYMSELQGVSNPRVALLSVGEEESKGNSLVKQASLLLKNDPNVNFIGNVESRDLLNGACDVLVCEGFVGNVVLKLVEGMSEALVRGVMERFLAVMPDQMATIAKVARDMHEIYDYNEYGGAPLLGVAGIWFICHGASNSRGIMNAIRRAREFAAHKLNQRISELFRDR
jgi:glycerol-3-phosphate acyltransferase PlsX